MKLEIIYVGHEICYLHICKDDLFLNSFYDDCVLRHVFFEGRFQHSKRL